MQTACNWIHARLEREHLTLTGPIVHERATFLSCVLRVPITQETLYFKASCSLYPFEPLLTAKLAHLVPSRVPAPIALEEERHWMLLHEAVGVRLDHDQNSSRYISHWQALLRDLAVLQQQLSRDPDALRALGCPFIELESLPALTASLLKDLPELVCDAEHPLSEPEWDALRLQWPEVRRWCTDLAGDGMPPSLVHGDCHSGNIRANAEACMLIDWAGFIAVTHPFLLLSVVAEELSDPAVLRTATNAYSECWRPYASEHRLQASVESALRLGPWYGALGHQRQLSIARHPWEREQEQQNLLGCLRLALARATIVN